MHKNQLTSKKGTEHRVDSALGDNYSEISKKSENYPKNAKIWSEKYCSKSILVENQVATFNGNDFMAILTNFPNPKFSKFQVKNSAGIEIGLKTISRYKINDDVQPDHVFGNFSDGDIVEIFFSGNSYVMHVGGTQVKSSDCNYSEDVFICVNGYNGSVLEYLP